MTDHRGLSVRRLIDTGVFTAIYFVVLAVFGQLGALIPILQVLGPLYIPIACGIPWMLFFTRVRAFGQITIMGLLVGVLLVATGQSWVALVLAVVLSPLADWIATSGDRGFRRGLLAYVVFSEMLIGMVVPLYFMRDAFFAKVSERHDSGWVDSLVSLTPMWMFFVMIGMLAVGAILGGLLGRGVLRRHFTPRVAPTRADVAAGV